MGDQKLGDDEVDDDTSESVRGSHGHAFEAIAGDGVTPVAESGIARVAVVMDIPEVVGNAAIRIGDQVLSVESLMSEALDIVGLPEATNAMQLEHVTFSRYYHPFDRVGVD